MPSPKALPPTRRSVRGTYEHANALWYTAERLAKGLTGPQVVRALERASSQLYQTGYDDAFREAFGGRHLSKQAVNSHDVGWLSVWTVELLKEHRKK